MHDGATSEQRVGTESSFPARFSTNQHAAPDYGGDTILTIDQAYEALGRVSSFLGTYPRKEFLINAKDSDMLTRLLYRFTEELSGTIIDKA